MNEDENIQLVLSREELALLISSMVVSKLVLDGKHHQLLVSIDDRHRAAFEALLHRLRVLQEEQVATIVGGSP